MHLGTKLALLGQRLVHSWRSWLYGGVRRQFWIGFLAAFSWPPCPYMAGFVVAFITLMVRVRRCTSVKEAGHCGWWWSMGWGIFTVYWVGNSLWIDAARFAWFWPLLTLSIPALFSLYPALGCALAWKIKSSLRMNVYAYALCFSALWSLSEYLRGHLFTGFPWNLTAYIAYPHLALTQGVSLLGSYGLGLVFLLIIALMGVIFMDTQRLARWCFISALISGIALYGWGRYRLNTHPCRMHPDIVLRLVHPCLAQKEKLDIRYAPEHCRILFHLSQWPKKPEPTCIIWPEGGFPWSLNSDLVKKFPDINDIGRATLLIECAYRASRNAVFPALMCKPSDQPMRAIYFKKHLLPLGEYVPLRAFWEMFLPQSWLCKITPGKNDFSCGDGPETLDIPGLPPFRCLICYESIFPRSCQQKPRAQWILNLTNDGWFGHSSGPYQHFTSARFRSIEEGLPMIRVANLGISAVIDGCGRILHQIPLNKRGFIDATLPLPLKPTLYSRYGDVLWGALLIAIFILSYSITYIGQRRSKHHI